MHPNIAKEKTSRGQQVFGCGISYPAPELVELAGALGFDFVTFDTEHEPMDELTLGHMIRAAEAFRITPIVRMPHDPNLMLRYLDVGAQGIHVPRVNSAAQAQAVVEACRYHPEGRRTFYALARSANYGINVDDRSYAEAANREVLVICMVEEVEGLRNLGEIVRVPGVDAIHIGPKDLWQSMGMPDRAVVDETVDGMIQTIVAAGRQVSVTVRLGASYESRVASHVANGVSYFTVGIPDLLASAAETFFGRVRRATNGVIPALRP